MTKAVTWISAVFTKTANREKVEQTKETDSRCNSLVGVQTQSNGANAPFFEILKPYFCEETTKVVDMPADTISKVFQDLILNDDKATAVILTKDGMDCMAMAQSLINAFNIPEMATTTLDDENSNLPEALHNKDGISVRVHNSNNDPMNAIRKYFHNYNILAVDASVIKDRVREAFHEDSYPTETILVVCNAQILLTDSQCNKSLRYKYIFESEFPKILIFDNNDSQSEVLFDESVRWRIRNIH